MAGYQMKLGKEIEDGRRLIDALKGAGLNPRAALWCYMPDTDEWRLAISFPMVDQMGSLKTYKNIRSVMLKMDPPVEFTLSDISCSKSARSRGDCEGDCSFRGALCGRVQICR